MTWGSQGISSSARAPGDLRSYSDSIFYALSFKTGLISLSLKLKKLGAKKKKKVSKILNFQNFTTKNFIKFVRQTKLKKLKFLIGNIMVPNYPTYLIGCFLESAEQAPTFETCHRSIGRIF